jgi:nucleoside-diphosphate-sugar epimerase
MYEQTANPLRLYRNINVEGTHNLARQATIAGVQRFIYISSIKVNGERTMDRPFREDDVPRPEGAYSISKWEAEQALAHVAATSSLDVVILRPPLIYGPGVRANFLLLMKAIRRGIPLPFGNVHNQRSLLYLGNLTDAIVTCINHPRAAGKTYVLSDNEDLSTTDLLRGLANAMGSPSRLLPIPTPFLRLAGKVIGKTDAMDRLIGSLVVDSYKIRQELNWNPPYTISQGLHETASWFLHNR